MQISQTSKLYIKDVYLYDIEACHYTILERYGFDLSKLDRNDKQQRNIQIGLFLRENKRLTRLLRDTTKSIIDEYIRVNKIEKDIIVRQYDGFITTRHLTIEQTSTYIPIPKRRTFNFILLSIDRKKYIAYSSLEDKVSIKGVPHRYEKIDGLFKKMAKKLVNMNTEMVLKAMEEIQDEIKSSKDPLLFCIPVAKGKYNVILKGYGEIEISETTTKLLDTKDIDRDRYFDFYLWPFMESILIEVANDYHIRTK